MKHLVPILVWHDHFLHYLLGVLIGNLHCPIHLGPIRRGIVVLDLGILTHLFHHFIVQIGGIVCDNFTGQPVLTDYLFLDEPDHHAPCQTGVRSSFHPYQWRN